MNLTTDLSDFTLDESWVTVGSFDGVHLGHQALARTLVSGAHREGCSAVVITFYPHPAVFFGRSNQAYTLTSPEERTSLLKNLGIDYVITLKFDEHIANLTAQNFMRLLKENLGLQHFLIGFNFALGRGRAGDMDALQQIGNTLDYQVEVIPPFKLTGEIVSSSQIRTYLQEGQLEKANTFLGRPYSLEGIVIQGEHRGNKLGFPTANLDIASDRLLPAKGVYASRAFVNGKSYTAVTNIGVRPTFAKPLESPRVEPHLLDLNEDLYGDFLKLELLEYLRPEQAFDSSNELIAQVNRDIEKTKELIKNAP